jgi:hypothetical protein
MPIFSEQTQASNKSMGLLWACLGIFILAAYLPLVIQAGISVDDWGDIAHNLECTTFWNCYGTWFPLFSNRPLAPLPITVMTFALGSWYSGYLLINSLLYLAAIGICAKVLRIVISLPSAIVFTLFAAIPMIAMPVITSPINQSTATVSFLLWSLSLWSLWRFLQSGSWKSWVLAYLLLLLAFLTYEVILPLLVLTAFLPWIHDSKKFHVLHIRYWAQFVAPILVVLAIVTLWQKGIAPQYMTVDSRLRFIPSHALAKLHTFFHVFYKQIPTLFTKMPSYIQWSGIFTAIIGICALIISQFGCRVDGYQTRSMTKSVNAIDSFKSWRFIFIASLCFLASSFIFILSNESAVSGGYEARGLSSTWFAFAILLAAFSSWSFSSNRFWHALSIGALAIFLGLCTLSFSVQRDQTIAAWNMQLTILNDVNQLIALEKPQDGSVILGDVPHYLPNNYNNEIVFSQPWDFGAAIALFNDNRYIAGPVIDSSYGRWNQLHLKDDVVHALNFIGAPLEKLWVYQFDIAKNKGSLIHIQTPEQFKQRFKTPQEQYDNSAR